MTRAWTTTDETRGASWSAAPNARTHRSHDATGYRYIAVLHQRPGPGDQGRSSGRCDGGVLGRANRRHGLLARRMLIFSEESRWGDASAGYEIRLDGT
jgi:hypothetical protein